MRIDCPSCHAAYDVPPERLASGRAVKCARCAKTWVPPAAVAAQPEAAPTEAAPTEAGAAERAPAWVSQIEPVTDVPVPAVDAPAALVQPLEPFAPMTEPLRHSRAPLFAAWLLSIAVLAALGWAAIDRRAAIMAAWPPSTRAYAAIGLAAPK